MNTILFERFPGEVRAVLLENGSPVAFQAVPEHHNDWINAIFRGRVAQVVLGMNAAFVDIGLPDKAYLHGDDVCKGEPIQKHIRQDQELIVQIKSQQSGKGPKCSTRITLPGHAVVYLPREHGVWVSKQIGSDERERLQAWGKEAIGPEEGLILRTGAAHERFAVLADELNDLRGQWQAALAVSGKAPVCLYREEGLLPWAIREWWRPGTRVIANRALDREAAVGLLPPDEVPLLHENEMLFANFGVDSLLEKACHRRIWLPSGGMLVLDHTEALAVIDVNSGKYTGKHNQQDTILRVNLEAAEEIARLLRLLDIAGMVVVDFIDMDTDAARAQVLTRMREKADGRVTLLGFTQLGLLELTRARRQSAGAYWRVPCPICQGGLAASPAAIAGRLVRQAALWLTHHDGVCEVHAHPHVTALELLERIQALPQAQGREVRVVTGKDTESI